MVEAAKPDGLVLDLQVIRPNPRAEVDGELICELDGEPLFRKADTARAAVGALVASGRLIEEAVDDHDVLKHYANGTDPSLTTGHAANGAQPTRRCPVHVPLHAPALRESTADCDDSG